MYSLYIIQLIVGLIFIVAKCSVHGDLFENRVSVHEDAFKAFVDIKNTIQVTPANESGGCDESKGMRMVFVKSDTADRYECMSMYPLFFDHLGRMRGHVCRNGHVNYYNLKTTGMKGDFCVCDR